MESTTTQVSAYGNFLEKASRYMAISAGVILCVMSLTMVVSVIGRQLFNLPIPGDFDIVGMGTAICGFLCLPYCQLRKGNITVDFFLANAPKPVTRFFDALAALLFAGLAAVFTWRMGIGLIDFYQYQDITQIIAIPLWWAFPFAVASFGLLTLNCLYMAFCDISGRESNTDKESA